MYHYSKRTGQRLDTISKETGHWVSLFEKTWSTTRHYFERNWSLCIIILKDLNRSWVLKSFDHIQMKSIYVKRLSERYKHLTAKIVNHSTLFFKYFETTYYVGLWWESGKCSSDRNVAVRDTHTGSIIGPYHQSTNSILYLYNHCNVDFLIFFIFF